MLPGIGYWNPTTNFETHLPCNNIYQNNNAYKCQGTEGSDLFHEFLDPTGSLAFTLLIGGLVISFC